MAKRNATDRLFLSWLYENWGDDSPAVYGDDIEEVWLAFCYLLQNLDVEFNGRVVLQMADLFHACCRVFLEKVNR